LVIDTQVLINQEFRNLIPPLQSDERHLLEQSILEEGCRDAIIIWKNKGYIVDGHNRYDICTKNNIPYRTFEKDFSDTEEVKIWIKKNQLGRRNLSPYLLGEYRIDIAEYQNRKRLARENVRATQNNKSASAFVNSQKQESINLTQELAKSLDVGEQTASRIIQIKEKAPEPIKAKLRTGDYSINEVYTAIKNAEKGNGHQPLTEEKLLPLIEGKKEKVHVSNNSGETEWNTPPEFIEAARKFMGSIDTDPASSDKANEIIKASKFYTLIQNGLARSWEGNVWMNPPYSQPEVSQFCELLVTKYRNKEITQACVLLNNATETKFYQNMLHNCSAVCFVEGRIKFINKNGQPGSAPLQGQTVLYFGTRTDEFGGCFGRFGVILYAKY
jgi:hypothetical protein